MGVKNEGGILLLKVARKYDIDNHSRTFLYPFFWIRLKLISGTKEYIQI